MWKRFLAWLLNDWIVVEVITGTWEITYAGFKEMSEKKAFYTILYSKILNSYRLKVSGHDPYNHSQYKLAVKHFSEKYTKLIK